MASIFLVEDGLGSAGLTELLSRRSHRIVASAPVGDALMKGVGEPPDLIVVDVTPGEESAISEQIEILHERLRVPVIYVAAPESLASLEFAKPFGYLVKPVPEALFDAVLEMILGWGMVQTECGLDRERLEHTMEDLSEAQALSGVGSWDETLATGELHFSDTCLRIHGLAPGASPRSIADLLKYATGEHRAHVEALIRKARDEDSGSETVYSLSMPDGSTRTLHQRIAVRRNAAGIPERILSTVQDITERTQYEDALRQSEKRASQLARERDFILEHTRDILYYIDSDANVYYISPAVEEITGFTADEWKGPFMAHMADTENNRRVIRESLETLRTGREWSPSDVDILHKDGRVLVAEVSERPIIEGNKVIGIVGVARDMTERRHTEHRLRQAAVVFDNALEAIIITDSLKRITAANRAFTEITGYSETEVKGELADVVNGAAEELLFRQEIWSAVDQKGRWTGEMWNRRKSGELFPAWVAISTIRDNRDSITHYVILFSDLSRIRESEDKLEKLAHYDPLTRLPNRLLFHSRLAHALRTAERQRNQVALLFIDLDHFKNINDTLGHPAGDRLLQQVADRLTARLRKEDTVAHLGGDEFIVILENLRDLKYVVDVAQKIMSSMERPYDLEGQEAVLTASIGIALYPQDGVDVTKLVQNADAAMYRAKDMGRARFQFYTTEFTTHAMERMELAAALRNALQRNEFVLYYQPQMSLRTGDVVGVEALLRWQHPRRGLLLPQAFIPLGEEIGLINAVGDWVLRHACVQAKAWKDAGARRFTMAVNLSAFQLSPGDGFADRVAKALRETTLDPHSVELEITESAIMRNAEEAEKLVKELKAIGLRLAIDDFGTGYSSMSYLKRFAADRLKVDSSFIRDIPQDTSDQAIAEAIIALGHSLQMKVIAEGVETAEQQAFLQDHGCDEMQGFFFSPPLTGEECGRMLLG